MECPGTPWRRTRHSPCDGCDEDMEPVELGRCAAVVTTQHAHVSEANRGEQRHNLVRRVDVCAITRFAGQSLLKNFGLIPVCPTPKAEHGIEKSAREHNTGHDGARNEDARLAHFGARRWASRNEPNAKIDGTQMPMKMPLSRPFVSSPALK